MTDFRASSQAQRDVGNDTLATLLGQARAIAFSLPREEGDDGEALALLVESAAQSLVVTLTAYTNAMAFQILDELLTSMNAGRVVDGIGERRRKILERNDAIRVAAARGNWNEFDRLTGIVPRPGEDGGGGDRATGRNAESGAPRGD